MRLAEIAMKEESMNDSQTPPVCLTIAGVDPSGGAGVIADIKTFTAFGCYAAAAVASLTFQNTQGVFGAESQTAETVRRQIEPVLDDCAVAAVKTGMLPTREIIEEVARIVEARALPNFVVDPVVRSTSGFDLIDDAALRSLIEKLFPLAVIVTPNLPEAERITGMKIETPGQIEKAARLMQSMGARSVVIKGGHMPISDFEFGFSDAEKREVEAAGANRAGEGRQETGRERRAVDFLYIGERRHVFAADFIETRATHGTGCTFAAAIAANLALGESLGDAVATAKRFVTAAIRTAPAIGKGHSPINHLVREF